MRPRLAVGAVPLDGGERPGAAGSGRGRAAPQPKVYEHAEIHARCEGHLHRADGPSRSLAFKGNMTQCGPDKGPSSCTMATTRSLKLVAMAPGVRTQLSRDGAPPPAAVPWLGLGAAAGVIKQGDARFTHGECEAPGEGVNPAPYKIHDVPCSAP